MSKTVTVSGTYGTYYYIDSSSSSDVLTWEEMLTNATYFYSNVNALYPDWTLNSIAGMLGNIRYEGAMNPSQWQYGLDKSLNGGYGLCQWTPATKLLDWLPSIGEPRTSIDGQVQRIHHEAINGGQWISTSKYPMTFSQFLASTDSPDTLASVWLYNYERPKRPQDTESYRRSMANTFYEYLSGQEPTPPEPPNPPTQSKKRMPIYMYPGLRKR